MDNSDVVRVIQIEGHGAVFERVRGVADGMTYWAIPVPVSSAVFGAIIKEVVEEAVEEITHE